MIKEHRKQQADKYEVLLKVAKSARVTQCDRAAKDKCADVPDDFPQSAIVCEKGQVRPGSHSRRSRKDVHSRAAV